MAYKDEIVTILNKAIMDEISASVFYFRQAEELKGVAADEVINALKEYGNEEFGHYTEIMAYAGKFGMLSEIEVSFENLTNSHLKPNLVEAMKVIEDLEKQAYNDYKTASQLALDNDDIETYDFFKELMSDEAKHLDEFLLFQGKTRGLNEKVSLKDLLQNK